MSDAIAQWPPRKPAKRSEPSGRRRGEGADLDAILPPSAYALLRDVLRDEEAFDLTAYRPAYLARRLRARLASVSVPAREYPRLVARDPRERRALMEALGVNVTGFFRDASVWGFLEEVALPPLLAQRAAAGRALRAVSLGCAGGQEAYSIAMLLAESTRDLTCAVPFTVDAFDVDPHALEMAAAGVYPAEALAGVAQAAVSRYFRELPDGKYAVTPWLRRHVRVRRLDILTARLPGSYDIAFCRNVMIYMDAVAKDRLIDKIHSALAADGLLVIGQSEVILGPSASRFRALSPRHRAYRKVGA